MQEIQPGDELPPGDPGGGGGGGGTGGGGTGGGGGQSVAGTIIFSGIYTKEDAGSMVFVTVWANLQAVDDLRGWGYLIVNNRVEQSQVLNQIYENYNSRAAGIISMAFVLTDLPPGPVQIAFAVRNTDPSGAMTVRTRAILRIEELKIPAL